MVLSSVINNFFIKNCLTYRWIYTPSIDSHLCVPFYLPNYSDTDDVTDDIEMHCFTNIIIDEKSVGNDFK